jgi:hypothetical protein
MALSLWDSYGLAGYELGAGNISEDSRGGGISSKRHATGRMTLNIHADTSKSWLASSRPSAVTADEAKERRALLDSCIYFDIGIATLSVTRGTQCLAVCSRQNTPTARSEGRHVS